jgi:hypothetical protein
MIKTEADLLDLTTCQRDVLCLIVRELSRDEAARVLLTAARAAKIDVYEIARKASPEGLQNS